MREICLDTETTGLDPKSGHKIIEIACVELINRVRTGNHYHVYVDPRRDVPMEAFKVHGISTEFLQGKPIFAHVAQDFLDYIKGATLVIHNAAFDMKFLNFELGMIGVGPLTSENVVDSLALARKKFPGAANSLDALCRRFNVDLSKRSKHGALLDSELLADVYIELMGGAQEGLKFSSGDDSSDSKNSQVKLNANKKIIASRNFTIKDEEKEAHKKFIADNFKENLWGY